MTKESGPEQTLRQRAEESCHPGATTLQNCLSLDEANLLLHELQVHQVELEMQNEELRRAQAELHAARARYFDLYDLAPVGYCTLNATGLILEANLTAATLLGVPRGALVNQPLSRFIHQEDHDPYYLHRQQLFKTGEPQTDELRMVKNDGTVFWTHLVATAAEGDDGTPACRVVLNDITGRKRAEEEKETLRAQLNQAQKMEAIGVLAGGIDHDFNNILSIIVGYTELAREDAPPGSELTHDLDNVLTAALRAKELTKQILAFSRQSTAERIPIKIQPMVREALKMLRASIPSTITIQADIQPQGGAVLADLTQVHQIVMNLCTNAYHAMEKTGGVLSIAVHATRLDHPPPCAGRELTPGDYVELTVSDTGSGIGPEIMDKIFDPYFTTKEIGKGTGMGLSISHGIIISYGGAITVESTVGQGTTFHVYFPVIQQEAMAPEEAPEAPRGTERILFVDDEKPLAEMGKNLLERLGYTVTACTGSSEALAAFMDNPARFDLVITDQTMPGMTGTDLARRMLLVRPELPIILCTGFSHLVTKELAKAIGIREFALKPFTKATLGQLIRKIL